MMPIDRILKCYVVSSDIVDLEMVAARLEHHRWSVRVDNMFLCDCGDNWHAVLRYDHNTDIKIEAHEPTLRKALTTVLTECARREALVRSAEYERTLAITTTEEE